MAWAMLGRSLISLGTQSHTQMWHWQGEPHELVKWPERRKLHLRIVVASKVPLAARLLCGLVEFGAIFEELVRQRQRREDANTHRLHW